MNFFRRNGINIKKSNSFKPNSQYSSTMKIIGINGSPRRGGNTEILIKTVFEELEKEGIETEFIQLGGKLVHGCKACGKCREIKDGRCHIKNDFLNEVIAKMVEADGMILGSPTYFADVSVYKMI